MHATHTQVERPIDYVRSARDAEYCVVPEGKSGGYGHRAIGSIMLG